MNRNRRKLVRQAHDLLSEARSILETVYDDEQDAYYNMPESLQYSERGERMSETVDMLSDMVSTLEDYETELEEIIEG